MACRSCGSNESASCAPGYGRVFTPGRIMSVRNSKRSKVAGKARQLLEFAEQRAQQAADWVELHNALFGLSGKATELLATESERTAFARTKECKRIFALLDN